MTKHRWSPAPLAEKSPRQPETNVSGVVLAGGRSRRLGTDKALLALGGQPLIVRTARILLELTDDLLVVTNQPAAYASLGLPARLVRDESPGQGSLMGIYSGVRQALHEHSVVVACDMPFLSLPLLSYMTTLTEGYDVVIPQVGGLYEPLHAIYGKGSLPSMQRLLASGERKIVAFFPEVRVRVLAESEVGSRDPEHLSFLNVNTPEEWSRIQAMLSSGSSCPR